MLRVERHIENLEDILGKGRAVIEQTCKLLLDAGKKEDYISLISYLGATSEINFAAELEAKYNTKPVEFWVGINPELTAKIAEGRKDFGAAIGFYEKEERPGDAMLTCMRAKEHYSKTDPEKAKHYEEKAQTYVEKVMKEHRDNYGPIGPCF